MRIKKLVLLITICLITIIITIPVYAESSNTINIDFSVENHTKGIDGAEFGLVKVLDYIDGVYSVNISLDNLGFSVDDVFDKTEDTAKLIAQEVSDISEKAITDKSGKAKFNELDDGVWLIIQTNRNDSAVEYNLSSPFLVSVPEWKDGILNSDVLVYPKTTKIPTPDNPTEPTTEKPSETTTTTVTEPTTEKPSEVTTTNATEPTNPSISSVLSNLVNNAVSYVKTGDTTQVSLALFGSLLISLVTILLIHRRREQNEK